AIRHVPETRDPTVARRLDPIGAALTVVGLGLLTFALIDSSLAIGVGGVAALVGFVVYEQRSAHPMLPFDIFRSAQFTGANLATFLLYGALSGAFFVLAIALQRALRYSPTAAGAALIPITLLMLALSPRAGVVGQRLGPRIPMTVGPLISAAGLALLTTVDPGDHYLTGILPAIAVFGFGLSVTVAPLTAAVLAAAASDHAGIASAVNNTVARVAGLLAVATLPAVVGLHGRAFDEPAIMTTAFHKSMVIAAVLAAAAGVVSWLTIRRDHAVSRDLVGERHCALDGPPLRPASHCDAA
ncbi:MAG TPA: MFS transporter, partial [Acidimicrobiales bacterium]|nr:MFS transporter [Acidimicrobiales bacterium]